jgi:integrase
VRRNIEEPSKVNIGSKELQATIDAAPTHFKHLMELAYMTGMRAVDLRLLKVADVTPDGLRYTESKNGKRVLMQWSERLRLLVREILEARAERINRPYANKYKTPRVKQAHDFLLVNRLGDPFTQAAISSNGRRYIPDGWSFRAIRAKAQTDAGDSRNVLGHMGQLRERYTRERKLQPVH